MLAENFFRWKFELKNSVAVNVMSDPQFQKVVNSSSRKYDAIVIGWQWQRVGFPSASAFQVQFPFYELIKRQAHERVSQRCASFKVQLFWHHESSL